MIAMARPLLPVLAMISPTLASMPAPEGRLCAASGSERQKTKSRRQKCLDLVIDTTPYSARLRFPPHGIGGSGCCCSGQHSHSYYHCYRAALNVTERRIGTTFLFVLFVV